MPPMVRIDCHKCHHYYVIWDRSQPHGCRRLGFKSRQFPSALVYQSSGAPCLHFALKQSPISSKTQSKDK